MSPTPVEVSLTSAAGTNPGLVRALNEDSLLSKFPVFIVADGMGGHSAGDMASQIVVATFEPLAGRTDVTVHEALEIAYMAQKRVSDLADGLPGGAGSTLTGLIAVKEPQHPTAWLVINIGDSRTYRKAGDGLVQLTVDHSLVQEMVDAGTITAEQAAIHPERNVITRALGDRESRVDAWTTAMVPGETYLIASDGLTGAVPEDELARELERDVPLRDRTIGLIEKALEAGGKDNITVILVETAGDGSALSSPLTPVGSGEVEDSTVPRSRKRGARNG